MKHIEDAFYIIGLLLAVFLVFVVFAALVIPVGAWGSDDGYPVDGYPVETPTRKPPPEQWTPVPKMPPTVEPKIAETEDNSTASVPNPAQGYPVESSEPQPETVEPVLEPVTTSEPSPSWEPEPEAWQPKPLFVWAPLADLMK
jgi:hypothetical protein